MKNKLTLILSIAVFILIIALVVLNTTKSLAVLKGIPNEESILYANITSTEYYSREDSYVYSLSNEELEELNQILSEQEVKRVFFNNDLSSEYILTLHTAKQVHFIEINNGLLYIQGENNTYELITENLYTFISSLNES